MAGTIVGSIEHRLNNVSSPDTNSQVFKTLYDFFNDVANCTLTALSYGTSGTGDNYYDEADPFDDNAFAVFTFASAATPFDVLIQWSDAETWTSTRLSGGTSADGVGMMVALREDGTSPWNGTTNADGTDTHGTPIWTPGGSTLHVLDVSNTTGGTYATNRENLQEVSQDYTSGFGRMHMFADDDTFIVLSDPTDNGDYRLSGGGLFVPRTGLTVARPVFMFGSTTSNDIGDSNDIIGTTNGNGSREGGLLTAAPGTVIPFSFGQAPDDLFNNTFQPNQQASPAGA